MKLIALFLLVFNFSLAHGADIRAIQKNKEALKSLEGENLRQAQSQLHEGLIHSPFDPGLRLNLGLTYLAQEKPHEALKEFDFLVKQLEGLNDPQWKKYFYYASFNAGVASALTKDVDKALSYYQKALQVVPDSIEAKTNIELLIQNPPSEGESGQGDGESEDDQEGEEPDDGDDGDKPLQSGKETTSEYQGKDLTQEDVRRIFEELQGQDQKIRALEFSEEGAPSTEPAKDW